MKSESEIRKLAEEIIPYNPYNNALFPGQRESEISGFVKGYMMAQKIFQDSQDDEDVDFLHP